MTHQTGVHARSCCFDLRKQFEIEMIPLRRIGSDSVLFSILVCVVAFVTLANLSNRGLAQSGAEKLPLGSSNERGDIEGDGISRLANIDLVLINGQQILDVEIPELSNGMKYILPLRLKNRSEKTYVISSASSTCGCTSAKISEESIGPQNSIDILVALNTPSHGSKFGSVLNFHLEDGENISMQLRAKMTAVVQFEPAAIESDRRAGKTFERKIKSDFEVLEVVALPHSRFIDSLEFDRAKSSCSIRITDRAMDISSDIREPIRAKIKRGDQSEIWCDCSLLLKSASKFRIAPKQPRFSQNGEGSYSSTVVVASEEEDGFVFKAIDHEGDELTLDVEVIRSSRRAKVLKLKLDEDSVPKRLKHLRVEDGKGNVLDQIVCQFLPF